MIRFLLRVSGLLAMAAGFVVLVIDGTRGIANSTFALTALSGTGERLMPTLFPLMGPAVERNLHPLLWDPVLTTLLKVPTFAAALLLGFLLLRLGRKPDEPIGFDTKA